MSAPVFVLRHHVQADLRNKDSWSSSVAPDAPPITVRMVVALRSTLIPERCRSVVTQLCFHHVDWNAWQAVTDLHRAGEHDDATGLARLLRWCEDRYTNRDNGMWEIEEGAAR